MRWQLLSLLLLVPWEGQAQVSLDKFFTNNMVLQRDKPITVYGKGVSGKVVKVSLGDHHTQAVVGADSGWVALLESQPASASSLTLRVVCDSDTLALHNLAMGDVWLCIGQSNMEWPMEKEMFFSEAKQSAQTAGLRFLNASYAGQSVFGKTFSDSIVRMLTPERFYTMRWQMSDSNTFRSMSAVAFYFGKQLHDSTGIPIGLINYAIGGAPLETFIDRQALLADARLSEKVNGDWLLNDRLPVWVRERGRQNVGTVNVAFDEYGKNHAFKPGFAYESGIKDLHRFPIKGVICYQGESNAQEIERVEEYNDLMVCLVKDYRKKWDAPSMPFYYVQLSSIDTVKYKGQLWGRFRDQQRLLLQRLPYTGMAVSSDRGDSNDVHPSNKRDIGLRLARWAWRDVYGKQVVPSGPLPVRAAYRNGKIIVTFQYAASGLSTTRGAPVTGFSLDGVEPVRARIVGTHIEIASTGKPAFVYYGWKPFSDGNLKNAEGLPASTFQLQVR